MKNASHKASHLSRTSTISCSMRLLRGGSSSRRSRSAWLRVCKMCSVSISLFDTGGCMHDFGKNSAGLHDVMIFQGGMYQKHQGRFPQRSEEHTSELQSLMRISYAVFCLKKKNIVAYVDYNSQTKQLSEKQ